MQHVPVRGNNTRARGSTRGSGGCAGWRGARQRRGWAVAAGWSDSLARCLELAGGYALEQGLLQSRPDIGELERECAAVELV